MVVSVPSSYCTLRMSKRIASSDWRRTPVANDAPFRVKHTTVVSLTVEWGPFISWGWSVRAETWDITLHTRDRRDLYWNRIRERM